MPLSEKARKFRKEINIEPSQEGFEKFMTQKEREEAYGEYSGKLGLGKAIDTTKEPEM